MLIASWFSRQNSQVRVSLSPVLFIDVPVVNFDRMEDKALRLIQLPGEFPQHTFRLKVVQDALTAQQSNQLSEDVPHFMIGALLVLVFKDWCILFSRSLAAKLT
jgi:hypothetical protein